MAKLTNEQKRCQDCSNLKIKNGVWYCLECFNQLCNDIDDCPEGCTLEQIKENAQRAKENKVKLNARAENQTKRTTTPKKDTDKLDLIKILTEILSKQPNILNLFVKNDQRELQFDYKNENYSIILTKHRQNKQKEPK